MLIGLSGDAGSGKDTVAKFLVEEYGFKRYAFADAVRDAALAIDPAVGIRDDYSFIRLSEVIEAIGWDNAKRNIPEVRRLLQRIGTEVGRQILGEDVWVDIVARKWEEDGYPAAVITDLRFPNEEYFSNEVGGIIVRIERANNPVAIDKSHASEQYVPKADYTIHNDSTLEALEDKVRAVFSCLVAEYGG